LERKEAYMTLEEIIAIQKTMLVTLERIEANQGKLDKIAANQSTIIENQRLIKANQETIQANQAKLLANQAEILSRLAK
jgi:hypothetical protein